MRILIVNDHPPGPTGGVERHISRLVAELERLGDEVAVFGGAAPHRGLSKVLDVWDPRARGSLTEEASHFQADVIHYHNFARELSASVLLAAPEVAKVVTAHDYRLVGGWEGPVDARRGLRWWITARKAALDRRVVRNQADVVIAVSGDLAQALERAGLSRVRMIGNFASAGPSPSTPPGDDVVYVGQMIAAKGVATLIEAFSLVMGQHPRARLLLVGGGTDAASLRAQAASTVGDRASFEGVLDEQGVARCMAESRVVCVPSTRATEGAPLVVLEAMLGGRAVIGTDSPAFRELIDPGGTGLIVPAGDVAALAAALDTMLADAEQATRMGEQARQIAARRHAPAAVVPEIRGAYEEAVATRRHRSRA